MKKHLLKLILSSLNIGLLTIFPSSLIAEVLNDSFDLNRLEGVKLGYYVGSFDPIHLGHQHTIEQAIKQGYVDYVLVYPAPGGDTFKNRSRLTVRQKMIASIYEEHPKVLLTYWTPKELQDKFSPLSENIEIIGIIGSDVVTDTLMGPDDAISEKYRSVFMRGIPLKENHYEDTIGALMALKASSFIVSLRGKVDILSLDGKIHDRPIKAFIQSENYSSTAVRGAIQDKRSFEPFLSFPVQAIIKEDGLYGFKSCFDNTLQRRLLEIQESDQRARNNIADIKNSSENLWKAIQEVDIQNGKILKEIIKEHGWPGVSLVGLEGTSAMWLLVQHQDQAIDFQKECLELLKIAVQESEAPCWCLAYLTDRVNMNEGYPQIYGTQWIQENGMFVLYPVDDIKHLNKRRSEMGLESIEEYKERFKSMYQLTDEDFR